VAGFAMLFGSWQGATKSHVAHQNPFVSATDLQYQTRSERNSYAAYTQGVYTFNEHFTLGGGIAGLPGTRSTSGTFPYWLGVDERLISDEFFRPSYTTGIWANGEIVDGLVYNVMLGNNLSQLGVDAGQLDDGLNTVATALAWMPTTGEFGKGFGDLENHDELATRFAVHYTTSDETRQGQPDTEAFENVQLRISDGNVRNRDRRAR
jgi:hypothetical protein